MEPMRTGPLPFISGDDVRRAVPIADMVDAVADAFVDVAAGRDRSPLRSHVSVDAGDLLMMPGVRAGASGFSVKLVTVVSANAERGVPTVQAVVAWFDARTGMPLALIDGPTLTAMRTGAASGAATRLLARRDAEVAAVIGAGAQAEWQLRAVAAVRPIRLALAYARAPVRRAAFAARMADACGFEVRPVDSADAAVALADVVCCATTSEVPVFAATAVRAGAHVNGVGAYRLGMVELPPELFGRATMVAVDARAAAFAEAGDAVAAIEAGVISPDELVEIGSVDPSWAERRPPDAVTVFKSVGLAIQDVAAAELIVERVLGASSGPEERD